MVFGSGAGRFVLKSLDVGLRTNLSTSAREFISFCKIENLPDLSVDALTAPTAVYELRSSLSVLCGTASCLSLVCFRVASIRPISASRRFALQRLCVASGLVFSGRFPVLALLPCSLGWLSVRSVFSSLITASSCSSGNALCLCVLCYTFLVSGMRWVWHLENYHRCSSLDPTMSCPVQFFLFVGLRLLVNECTLLLCASHAHSVSLGFRCLRDNGFLCVVFESCRTKCFNDLVGPSDSSQVSSVSCWCWCRTPTFSCG